MIYSNTEFYYSDPEKISDSQIILDRNESKHIASVMRHKVGDGIYITDGIGNVYETVISEIGKSEVNLRPISKSFSENKFSNIQFYIPLLKSSGRMEFALEKCVELGITEFVFFSSQKSEKKNVNTERLNKIAVSAMKQSLRCYKPKLSFINSILDSDKSQNEFILCDQLADKRLSDYLSDEYSKPVGKYLFGPEGGFSRSEMDYFALCEKVKLSDSRLRSETAIITAASLISSIRK